jgi:hypothetical protein
MLGIWLLGHPQVEHELGYASANLEDPSVLGTPFRIEFLLDTSTGDIVARGVHDTPEVLTELELFDADGGLGPGSLLRFDVNLWQGGAIGTGTVTLTDPGGRVVSESALPGPPLSEREAPNATIDAETGDTVIIGENVEASTLVATLDQSGVYRLVVESPTGLSGLTEEGPYPAALAWSATLTGADRPSDTTAGSVVASLWIVGGLALLGVALVRAGPVSDAVGACALVVMGLAVPWGTSSCPYERFYLELPVTLLLVASYAALVVGGAWLGRSLSRRAPMSGCALVTGILLLALGVVAGALSLLGPGQAEPCESSGDYMFYGLHLFLVQLASIFLPSGACITALRRGRRAGPPGQPHAARAGSSTSCDPPGLSPAMRRGSAEPAEPFGLTLGITGPATRGPSTLSLLRQRRLQLGRDRAHLRVTLA